MIPESGSWLQPLHESVMVSEVLEFLGPKPGGRHLELGVSTGGHLLEICRRLGGGGFAVGIDLDEEAIEIAAARFKEEGILCRVELIKGNYGDLPALIQPLGIAPGRFETCILDSGVSGFQFSGERGFSYLKDQKLDMRYGRQQAMTAEEIVNSWTFDDLTRLFREVADIPEAARAAEAIVAFRSRNSICTTLDLVEALKPLWPERMPKRKRMNRLGRVFMSLREAVNDGHDGLRRGLDHAVQYLDEDGGRLALITFSGDESRVAKAVTRAYRKCTVRNPDWILKEITPRAIKPSRAEIKRNPASHSGVLRVFAKRSARKVEV